MPARDVILLWFAAIGAVSGCSKDVGRSPSEPSAAIAPSVFYGIEYRAPAGTRPTTTDGTLPGPGGQGGIPTGERPSVVLIKGPPKSFYVEIVKSADPVSLDGMTRALVGSKAGSNMQGTVTSTGWALTYDPPGADDAATGKDHIIYIDAAGGHYQCTYADANCTDPAAAEAICRSMRAKQGK